MFKPIGDRILVRTKEPEKTTKSGIVLVQEDEKLNYGEVVAVGSHFNQLNGKKIPLQVKVGDQIHFGQYGGQDISIDGEKFLVMRESDVLGIS